MGEFKYALVWGTSSKHYPQRCGLSHPLEDEDVVQVGLCISGVCINARVGHLLQQYLQLSHPLVDEDVMQVDVRVSQEACVLTCMWGGSGRCRRHQHQL